MSQDRLTLHCFPSSDDDFRRRAEELLNSPETPSTDRDGGRAAFEMRLRAEYPATTVQVRDAFASLGGDEVWYVYRGGRYAAHERWRVLIVEDNRDLARMMEAAIGDEGIEVRSASDGQSALGLTAGWQPDAIVLDLGLPRLDGAGFAAAYRRRSADVPIIVVSGAPDASDTSRQIGARAWLPKPFELEHLIELVRPPTSTAEPTRGEDQAAARASPGELSPASSRS